MGIIGGVLKNNRERFWEVLEGIIRRQIFEHIRHIPTVPTRFYESLNEKNWMSELCMFSQIRSHNVNTVIREIFKVNKFSWVPLNP